MDDETFDELAGRIEGLARAVLHIAAALEMQGVIDGPRMSERWRGAVAPHTPGRPSLATAHLTLQELAKALDDARATRQARASQL